MTMKSDAQFEEKLTCGLEMTWGICKLSLEHLIVSKFDLWWDPLIKSRKSISLKFAEELHVMTVMQNVKKKWLVSKILMNFDPSTWKSQKFSL